MRTKKASAAFVVLLLAFTACSTGEIADSGGESPAPSTIAEEQGPSAPDGTETGIPADFSVPVYEGGTVKMVLDQDDGTSVAVTYPQAEFGPIKVFYGDFVTGKKIVLEATSEEPRAATWIIEDQGQTIHITVAESGDNTELVIAVISGTN